MKTILIATDFTDAASNAITYGTELACFLDSKIILTHAFSLPVGGYDSMAPLNIISEMQNSAYKALREIRENIITRLGRDPGIECVAVPGSSDGVIAETVHSFNVNLVVLGIAAGAGPLKRHWIGSTVLDAIHGLNVPVLVVPEKANYSSIKKITFAVDPNPDDDMTAFIAAKNFATVFNAQLEVLSVVQPKAGDGAEEATLKRIDNNLKDVEHKTIIIKADDVGATLENYASSHDTSLFLLHPRKHGLFSRLFETGITSRLVYTLRIPMITFHS